MIAGRPIVRAGDAPVPPAPPKRVSLGRRLSGQYIQAEDAPIQISWDGQAWITVAPGPERFFLVAEPFVLVRAEVAPARYVVVGILR